MSNHEGPVPFGRRGGALGRALSAVRAVAPPGTGLPLLLTGLLCAVIVAVQCSRPAARSGGGDGPGPDSAAGAARAVRVLLSLSGPGIEVRAGDGGGIEVRAAGASFRAESPLEVKADGPKLAFAGSSAAGIESADLRSESGAPLRVGQRSYAGEIRVLTSGSGAVTVVNVVPMAAYLEGVVGSEMPPDWPIEALKSQAVAARTFAASRMRGRQADPFDVYDDTRSQVYIGVPPEGHDAVRSAVAETGDLVLCWSGNLIPAFFHSTCGGRTESASDALTGEYPPPLCGGVECGFCGDSKRFRWSARIPASEAGEALGVRGLKGIRISKATSTGRAAEVELAHEGGEKAVRAAALRAALGNSRIMSTAFTVEMKGGDLVFEGRGWGHGAGMCQWGARGMAKAGKDFREILGMYYPGANLRFDY